MPDPVRLAVLVTLAAAVALSACGAPRVSPPHEGYVQAADGVELYYRTLGQAADTVVVVRGGLGLDHGYLAPDLEPLAESSGTSSPRRVSASGPRPSHKASSFSWTRPDTTRTWRGQRHSSRRWCASSAETGTGRQPPGRASRAAKCAR
jgi:hypothetical protein